MKVKIPDVVPEKPKEEEEMDTAENKDRAKEEDVNMKKEDKAVISPSSSNENDDQEEFSQVY